MATSIPKSRSRSSHITLDLDLDYLEDPTLFEPSHNPKSPVRHHPDRGVESEEEEEEEVEEEEDGGSETCTDSMELDDFVKIILLGAPGVGKTSIIQVRDEY
uniref:Uncharacterized protein n=1 Tax=Cacopsylla melanoneura TaxID=428564 RepID=A0A8D9E322_9HEMI